MKPLKVAYETWQKTVDFVRQRQRAYQVAFTSPAGSAMLTDLAKFCRARAQDSCFHPDPRVHAVLEGRREVYMRIIQHLRLNPEQLSMLYAGATDIELIGATASASE